MLSPQASLSSKPRLPRHSPKPPRVLLASLSLTQPQLRHKRDLPALPVQGLSASEANLTAQLHLPAAPALAIVDGPQRGHLLQAKPWPLDSARQPHACPCDGPSRGPGPFPPQAGQRGLACCCPPLGPEESPALSLVPCAQSDHFSRSLITTEKLLLSAQEKALGKCWGWGIM